MMREMLGNVRTYTPLMHCITNYVTVNDCANILLACGGSPIMADGPEEAEEITAICSGLVINIGTLNQGTVAAMLLAGKKANELGHPVVLDPVGAGASTVRTETALKLLREVKFTVIRGNISEIKTLAQGFGTTKGVDADAADAVTEDTLASAVTFVSEFAEKMGSVVVVTGAVDLVGNGKKVYAIRNGHPMMSRITGSGCMLSVLCGAYAAANGKNPLEAAAAAVCAMGLCGERAFEKMEGEASGNSTFRNHLIDEIFKLDGESLEKGARYDVYER